MRYLVLDTEQLAIDRSQQEAVARGCSGTTLYWWPWRKTSTNKWALILQDTDNLPNSTNIEPVWA